MAPLPVSSDSFTALVMCMQTHWNCLNEKRTIINVVSYTCAFPLMTNQSACWETCVLLLLSLPQWKLTFKPIMRVVFCFGHNRQPVSGITWTPTTTILHIKSQLCRWRLDRFTCRLLFFTCSSKVIQVGEMLWTPNLSYVRWCLRLQFMRFSCDRPY